MKEKTPLIVIACLVTFAAIANLVRLLWDIPISIGSFFLPGWTGAIGFVLFGLLGAWAFRGLCSGSQECSSHLQKESTQPQPSPSTERRDENHRGLD